LYWDKVCGNVPQKKLLKRYENSEIGKAKQAYGPMAPGFQKLWAISKKYGPWQYNGMGQKFKKRNIGILVRDATFVSVYHTASCSWH